MSHSIRTFAKSRRNRPFSDWIGNLELVPGGVVRYKEAATERVHAVARLELGIAVTFDTAPILVTENINPGGRERAHAISLLYRCRLTSTLNPCRRYTQESPVPDQWLWHERCPTNLIPKQRAYAALIG